MTIRSDVLAELQSILARSYNVQGVPPLGLTGGISPTTVISSLNPSDAAFIGPNVDFDENTAPAAGTVLSTTGPLAAGIYDFLFYVSAECAASEVLVFRVRDQTPTTQFEFKFHVFTPGLTLYQPLCFEMEENWEAVVFGVTAFGAGETVFSAIAHRRRSPS